MQMCLPENNVQPESIDFTPDAGEKLKHNRVSRKLPSWWDARWHCAARHVMAHLSGEMLPAPGVRGPNSSGDWLAGGPARGVMVGPSGTAS